MRFVLAILAFVCCSPVFVSAQDPESARDFAKRGDAEFLKGDIDRAIVDFTKALEISPALIDARMARGRALRLKGDFDGAISDFEEVGIENATLLTNNRDVVMAYNTRGNLRVNALDLDGAVSDFDKAVRCNPTNADSFIKRGEAKLIRGDIVEAITDFDTGLSMHPGKLLASIAFAARGYANLVSDHNEKAQLDFDQSIKLNTEGKFFLALHLKLIETRMRALKQRRDAEKQMIAGYSTPPLRSSKDIRADNPDACPVDLMSVQYGENLSVDGLTDR